MSKEKVNDGYAGYPRLMRPDRRIKDSDIVLFTIIKDLTMEKGYCYASNAYLAEYRGYSEREVQRMLKRLLDAGYIRIERSSPRSKNRKIYIASIYDKSVADKKSSMTNLSDNYDNTVAPTTTNLSIEINNRVNNKIRGTASLTEAGFEV